MTSEYRPPTISAFALDGLFFWPLFAARRRGGPLRFALRVMFPLWWIALTPIQLVFIVVLVIGEIVDAVKRSPRP